MVPVHRRVAATLAVAVMVLGGCGNSGTAEDAAPSTSVAQPATSVPAAWPGDEALRPGPAATIESSRYRFTIRNLGAGTTPQLGPTQSAPPGTTYPFVVLLVHNEQNDRSAPLMDQLYWRLAVQRKAVDWDGCEDLGKNRCAQYVRCIALTAPGGESRWLAAATDLSDHAKQNNSMPAAATWRLTCYPADPSGKTFYAAKSSAQPTDISMLRMTDKIPDSVEQEFIPAA
jgi:hypothetical protein